MVVVSSTTVSFWTLNVRLPTPFGSPSVSLTPHRTTQVPFGSGSMTSAVRPRLSSVRFGRPMLWSSALQSRAIVLTSPSSSVKTISICAGDVEIFDPSAGLELATEFSANAEPGASVNRPSTATNIVMTERRNRLPVGGTDVRLLTVVKRLVP